MKDTKAKVTPLAVNPNALASMVREVTGTDYNALADKEKVIAFERISAIIYRTIIKDTIAQINTLGYTDMFIEPVKFGNGYRILMSGIGGVENFSDSPDERYPQTRHLLPDYEQVITTRTMFKVRITYNYDTFRRYFKDLNGLAAYLEMNKKRITDTVSQLYQDSVLRLFGDADWPMKTAKDPNTLQYTKGIDEMRNTFKRTLKVRLAKNDISSKVKFLMDFISTVTRITSDKFNLGWDGQEDETKFNKLINNPRIGDIKLILSTYDVNEFATDIKANTYNTGYFNWPEIKQMALPIKKGTFILVDKNAFQIAPNLNATYSEYFINTLDTDIVYHQWQFMGVVKNAFGVKLEFSDNDGKTWDEIYSELFKKVN